MTMSCKVCLLHAKLLNRPRFNDSFEWAVIVDDEAQFMIGSTRRVIRVNHSLHLLYAAY